MEGPPGQTAQDVRRAGDPTHGWEFFKCFYRNNFNRSSQHPTKVAGAGDFVPVLDGFCCVTIHSESFILMAGSAGRLCSSQLHLLVWNGSWFDLARETWLCSHVSHFLQGTCPSHRDGNRSRKQVEMYQASWPRFRTDVSLSLLDSIARSHGWV